MPTLSFPFFPLNAPYNPERSMPCFPEPLAQKLLQNFASADPKEIIEVQSQFFKDVSFYFFN